MLVIDRFHEIHADLEIRCSGLDVSEAEMKGGNNVKSFVQYSALNFCKSLE